MKKFFTLMLGLTFCFSAAIAFAAPYDFTVGDEGTLSTDAGSITGVGAWAVNGVSLSWDVENNQNGTYTYTYVWTAPINSRDLSHLTIQVSDDFSEANVIDWSVAYPDFPSGSGDETFDIGNLDGIPWAFKFDDLGESTTYTLSLTTNRMPMDGNFYAMDGTGTNAKNTLIDEFNYYIAVPDTFVPIPSALWLLGSGVLGLVFVRRKFKK
jgi:hypothetical protein